MIARIESIDEIRPIYREYLAYISQYYDIKDYRPWRDTALEHLRRYAIEADRYIYIVKKLRLLIGFALVNQHLRFNTDGLAVAEFYIQKDHSRKGYGRKLAEHVFSEFSGNWEVAVTLKNSSAALFWKQVVETYTHGKFMEKRKPSFNGYGFIFNNG
ncbi:MAG: GNAT family N-acetyltransferase [Desulfobacteraceae bacterium]|nr:GNAT family N-acetyltransferase [Desulfobacteraceae bacterium]